MYSPPQDNNGIETQNRSWLHCVRSFNLVLTVPQGVNKFTSIHQTRIIIIVSATARRLSLSWTIWVQYTLSNPMYLRSILILSSHLFLGLQSHLFLSGFWTESLHAFIFSSIRATCPAHLILPYLRTQTMKLLMTQFSSVSCYLSLAGQNIFLSILFSNIFGLCSSLNVTNRVSYPYKTT